MAGRLRAGVSSLGAAGRQHLPWCADTMTTTGGDPDLEKRYHSPPEFGSSSPPTYRQTVSVLARGAGAHGAWAHVVPIALALKMGARHPTNSQLKIGSAVARSHHHTADLPAALNSWIYWLRTLQPKPKDLSTGTRSLIQWFMSPSE